MLRAASISLLCLGSVVAATAAQDPLRADADAAVLPAVAAVTADSLVDSYGVGIHLAFLDTPYVDATAVADKLSELGVRHVRDDLFMNNPRQYAGIKTVADKGIKFNLILGKPTSALTPADYVETVAMKLPTGSVESVEGTNEWDLSGRDNWVPEMQSRQRQLYEAAKANPVTAQLPVLAPALAFRWNYLPAGDLSEYADEANGHMYPGGYPPSNQVGQITTAIRGSIPTKPLITTEAGYHNAVNTTNGHLPVPEDVAGVYMPRLLLEHYLRGTKRVYSYELIDEFDDPGLTNPEAHFGLLRRDLSAKPAFAAMKTLLGLAADPGARFAPGLLTYRLEGAPSDVRQLLVQKRDGAFVLFVWRDVAVYDPVSQQRLDVAPAPVTLRLGSPAEVTTHRPTEGPMALSTVTSAAVPLLLDGEVQALTIASPLAAPSGVQALPGDASATVRWQAPSGANGITGFHVTRQPGNVRTRVGSANRSLRIPGLVNGGRYVFSVRSVAGNRVSGQVSAVPVVPATKPTSAAIATVTPGRRGSVAVSWKPANGRGRTVTAYQVICRNKSVMVGGSSRRAALKGLPRGVRVRVGVRARNAMGWSPLRWSRVVRTLK